jgi:hypothetical protein
MTGLTSLLWDSRQNETGQLSIMVDNVTGGNTWITDHFFLSVSLDKILE